MAGHEIDAASSEHSETGFRSLEGRYANYLEVGHSAAEFLLDFGQYYPQQEPKAIVHTRIVTSPIYVKAFSKLLKDSIDRHETAFGGIEEA